jgi:aminoglycoside/choline kinase family phosphotransferase/GTP:adenosylcobinamide-phosphate guanylyltransferase
MKALILAAGFGTRLLPHTQTIPKALFPIAGRPMIDIIIDQLVESGCSEIMINAHHLHEKISSHVRSRNYPIPVHTRFEEKILGTGGAIKNVSDFLEDRPFLVINSDILSDINLRAVFEYHIGHPHPATLVMHDYPEFNSVWLDAQGFVVGFDPNAKNRPDARSCIAFTGIQIVNPVMMDFIPENQFISSIDVYGKMIRSGHKIATYIPKDHYWRDIGSPESYTMAALEKTAPMAFLKAYGKIPSAPMSAELLAGDGSDRKWYRIKAGNDSLVMADHGIKSDDAISEINSFLSIGRHLFNHRISVPEIYHEDIFAGLVYLEDLGDTSLQLAVSGKDHHQIISLYESVIDQFLRMAVHGARSFDTSWTYQTSEYTRELILERECRYFADAFLTGYLNLDIGFGPLSGEFHNLADLALKHSVKGFMHRDLQSRNIMVRDSCVSFIDFQGGRIGPIQYDLASLLMDPYVNLPESIQSHLVRYCLKQLQTMIEINALKFISGYGFCTVTRLLQALGAFGYLSMVKGKKYFESYIPVALTTLQKQLDAPEMKIFIQLKKTVEEAAMRLKELRKN